MKVENFNSEEFGELKVAIVDNEYWFVGRNVAKMLGYVDTAKAVLKHCKRAVALSKLTPRQDGNGSNIKTDLGLSENATTLSKMIPESDFFSLVLHSKVESAERFTDWVAEKVLPVLRKSSSHTVNQEHLTQEAFDELNNQLTEILSKLQSVSARDVFKGKRIEEMNYKLS